MVTSQKRGKEGSVEGAIAGVVLKTNLEKRFDYSNYVKEQF